MRTGECSKYKLSCIWLTHRYLHIGQTLIGIGNLLHIGEVQLRIDSMGEHIHCHGHNIHVSGTLTISEKCSLDTISSGQNTQLRRCHTAATVVVRMQGKNNIVSVFQMLADILDLCCKYMRHRIFHGRRNIDDRLGICLWLPYIQNGIAHLNRILYLGAMEALRAVLKTDIALYFCSQLLEKLCSVHSDLFDLFFRLAEYLLSLCNRCGIIYMNNGIWCTVYSLKGLADNVLSCLCQYLHRHIIRNQLPVDQSTQKVVFRLGCSRKSNLDLLETDLNQHLKKLNLFLKTHWLDQCLITISKIHTAPYRRLCDAVLFYPVISCL